MLARSSEIIVNDVVVARTPLLVPSYSSKGFSELNDVLAFTSEFITDCLLVSAYDVHYYQVATPDWPGLIFLDSGGYEAEKDHDLGHVYRLEHIPREWNRDLHQQVISDWPTTLPTVFISYDHPDERRPVDVQIAKAESLRVERPQAINEVLLRREGDDALIPVNNIASHAAALRSFDLIGVTEKELGSSLGDRLLNTAKLRRTLDAAGVSAPIHVFGNLDSFSTPLFFLAGAEIFDGLGWLRFAFRDGRTSWIPSGVVNETTLLHSSDADLHHRAWVENLYYLSDLRAKMSTYLTTRDLTIFGPVADLAASVLALLS